jgi:hypothetical protein
MIGLPRGRGFFRGHWSDSRYQLFDVFAHLGQCGEGLVYGALTEHGNDSRAQALFIQAKETIDGCRVKRFKD